MRRHIDTELRQWKDSPARRPLLVRGARQVGKTFSVACFGKREFQNCVLVNFEERPEMAACFESLDVSEIVEKISVLTASEIVPGKTLLFLDEIQDCPRAIVALRYFFEKMPALHVIGAGSLIELAFRSEAFRMPVGRITSTFMDPLSFTEFLWAMGHDRLAEHIGGVDMKTGVDPLFRKELERMLRKYLVVGGMPAVVSAYADRANPEEVKTLQTAILQTFQADFAKYATTAKHKYMKDVFVAAARLVGKPCKYTHINPHVQSRELKIALELLEEAGCLHPVRHSSGHGIPLAAQVNPKKFKLLFMDVGLMQRALGLNGALLTGDDLMAVNSGGVAEQVVGQQLLASIDPMEERRLFYWSRDKRSSQAEVDFLVTLNGKVLPVEVKSGKSGRLKSIRIFLDEHPDSPFGLRFSTHELSWHDGILSIPLYMVEHWETLARQV